MTIFERIIPFPQRLQWLMLKTALDGDFSAPLIATRLEWSLSKVRNLVWGDPGKIKIDAVAEWFFACGGQIPRFEVIKDGETFGL